MKNAIHLTKGVVVLILLFSAQLSIGQVSKKAYSFQKKGHYYYRLFQKEELKTVSNDNVLLKNLQKSDLNFNSALVLYNTNPVLFKEKIDKLKLYLKIIAHYKEKIIRKRRSFISSSSK